MSLDEYIFSLKSKVKSGESEPENIKILEHIVSAIHNNPAVINDFKLQTGFKIVEDKESDINENSSPVCYANDPELREEFRIENLKETVTYVELLHCIYAVYKSKGNKVEQIDLSDLLYAIDRNSFFMFARTGKQILGEV